MNIEQIVAIIKENYLYFYNTVSPVIGQEYFQLFSFTFGLFIYAVFVWHFYRTLSKRDLFKIDLEKYKLPHVKHKTLAKIGDGIGYILKYGLIFPVYIFLWFLFLSLFLLLLSEELAVNHILMTSIVVVSATRVASYYKEELSVDMAKLVPFALLAILISDPNFFSVETTLGRLSEIPNLSLQIFQFLVFSIILEWSLRSIYLIRQGIRYVKRKSES